MKKLLALAEEKKSKKKDNNRSQHNKCVVITKKVRNLQFNKITNISISEEGDEIKYRYE